MFALKEAADLMFSIGEYNVRAVHSPEMVSSKAVWGIECFEVEFWRLDAIPVSPSRSRRPRSVKCNCRDSDRKLYERLLFLVLID